MSSYFNSCETEISLPYMCNYSGNKEQLLNIKSNKGVKTLDTCFFMVISSFSADIKNLSVHCFSTRISQSPYARRKAVNCSSETSHP